MRRVEACHKNGLLPHKLAIMIKEQLPDSYLPDEQDMNLYHTLASIKKSNTSSTVELISPVLSEANDSTLNGNDSIV